MIGYPQPRNGANLIQHKTIKLYEPSQDSDKMRWQVRCGVVSGTALGTEWDWRQLPPRTEHARLQRSGGSGCTGIPCPSEHPPGSMSPLSRKPPQLVALGTCPRFQLSLLREVCPSGPRPVR